LKIKLKRWQKIALVVAGLVVLSQTPFMYRRYRLGQLRTKINAVNASRAAPAVDDPFAEFKGVIHVHTFLGGHSFGTFDEVVAGAYANGLDFVVMTEHPSRQVDTAEATLKGVHDGILFVNGSELAAANGERVFVVPGVGASIDAPDAQSLITQNKTDGRLAFVAYPETVRDWNLEGYDGIEVYNLYTNSQRMSYTLLFFDLLWSPRERYDLLFSTFYEKPTGNLRRWDELLSARSLRLTAIAGNDAHSNVGLYFGDRTGEPSFGVKLDPYARSFRVVRNHVLLEKGQPLDSATLLDALRRGRSFIAFDLFGDATGFRFHAENSSERKTMGDEIALADGGEVRLKVTTPVKSRVVFMRDGETVHEERDAASVEFPVNAKGVYRVEVYLDRLQDFIGDRPWIISNPIYVR
jgi:hypothetical protein